MNKQTEALKMAIEFIERHVEADEYDWLIQACKKALAEAEKQEPVAVIETYADTPTYTVKDFTIRKRIRLLDHIENLPLGNLYTHSATWQSLSDDEIEYLECLKAPPVHPDFINDDSWYDFARAIEQALKELNAKK